MIIHVHMSRGESVRTTADGIVFYGPDGTEFARLALTVPVEIIPSLTGWQIVPVFNPHGKAA